jgi:hypothetical protein
MRGKRDDILFCYWNLLKSMMSSYGITDHLQYRAMMMKFMMSFSFLIFLCKVFSHNFNRQTHGLYFVVTKNFCYFLQYGKHFTQVISLDLKCRKTGDTPMPNLW